MATAMANGGPGCMASWCTSGEGQDEISSFFGNVRDAGRRIRHDRGIDQAEHQSGVLIVGYSYGYFAARDLVRMGACLTVAEFPVLLTGPILLATCHATLT